MLIKQDNNSSNNNADIVLSKKNERIMRNMVRITNKFYWRVHDLPSLPLGSEYFLNILKRIFIDLRGIDKEKSVKTIGTYCVMIPEELIYAAGCIPVKLCSGNYTSFSLGDEITPRDACPLVKSSIGFHAFEAFPLYNDLDLVIITTSCDCKRNMIPIISKFKDVLPMHVPSLRSHDDFKENYLKDLYKLKDKLENISQREITKKDIKTASSAIAHAQYEISRFSKLKRHVPSVIKGTHAMAVLNSYGYDRVDRWTKALRDLNTELELKIRLKKFAAKENTPRIMITGSPIIFPNIKVPLLIEELGGIVVADETCMGERGLADPVAITENTLDGIMRAFAVRYILPCTCPSFVNNEQRIYRIKQMIEDNKVEGVIYHVLRGCLVYDYEYMFLEEELNKMNIPIIRLETDYNEEDVEQISIRLDAFIELIKFKKLGIKDY